MKFKDADLIGIPLRLTVGKKALAQSAVEMKARTDGPKQSELIPLADCARLVHDRIRAALQPQAERR